MGARIHAFVLVAAVAGASACLGNSAFTCEDASECRSGGSEGVCEASGYCSFPDATCPTGRRYGQHSGGLSGECVDDSGTSTGTSGQDGGVDSNSNTTPGTDDPSDPTAPGMTTSDGIGTWWHCDWPHRRALRITLPDDIDPQADVPVLVVLDDSRIDYSGTAPNGDDLRFIAEDDATALHHEIEAWDPAGISYAWLRVPMLVAGEQTIYMYYGNENATPLTDVDVWGADFRGVWHLEDGASDASGNAHDGMEMGVVPSPGYVASARAIRSAEEYVIVPDELGLADPFAQGGTVSAWVRPDPGFGQGRIVGKAIGDNADGGWLVAHDYDRQSFVFVHGFANGRATWRAPDGVAQPLAWTHVAVVFDDSTADPTPTMYVDGSQVGLDLSGQPHSGAPDSDAGKPMTFGVAPEVGGTAFLGVIDEVRLEIVARAAVWQSIQHSSFTDDLVDYGPEMQSECN